MSEFAVLFGCYGLCIALEIVDAIMKKEFRYIFFGTGIFLLWISFISRILGLISNGFNGELVTIFKFLVISLSNVLFLLYMFTRGLFLLSFYYLKYARRDTNCTVRVQALREDMNKHKAVIILFIIILSLLSLLPLHSHLSS